MQPNHMALVWDSRVNRTNFFIKKGVKYKIFLNERKGEELKRPDKLQGEMVAGPTQHPNRRARRWHTTSPLAAFSTPLVFVRVAVVGAFQIQKNPKP
jgi:hypothetical protein